MILLLASMLTTAGAVYCMWLLVACVCLDVALVLVGLQVIHIDGILLYLKTSCLLRRVGARIFLSVVWT